MQLEIIYGDNDILAIDKPAGIVVFPEGKTNGKTLIDYILEKYPELKGVGEPPRYGIVHRLDKDTSGIILTAKNSEALFFLQKQFSASALWAATDEKNSPLEKNLKKRYIALVVGDVKNESGVIETLIGRSKKDGKKQKVYLAGEPGSMGKREAITEYKIIKKYPNYTLLEVMPRTGRKHQIRCHLAYLGHPIAGDKMYGFKNQLCPKRLTRHFLHASYLKIQLPNGELKEFKSDLPEELKIVLKNLS